MMNGFVIEGLGYANFFARITAGSPVDPVLGEAQGQLAAMPEVDMDRVNAMKDAISAGKIDINLDELTLAIEKYYKG